jgi:hypothetical protein
MLMAKAPPPTAQITMWKRIVVEAIAFPDEVRASVTAWCDKTRDDWA